MAESEYNKSTLCEAVRVKPKLQWSLQDVEVASTMVHMLREAVSKGMGLIPERARGYFRCQSWRVGSAQAFWNSHDSILTPRYWTWSCRI